MRYFNFEIYLDKIPGYNVMSLLAQFIALPKGDNACVSGQLNKALNNSLYNGTSKLQ